MEPGMRMRAAGKGVRADPQHDAWHAVPLIVRLAAGEHVALIVFQGAGWRDCDGSSLYLEIPLLVS